MDDDRLIGRVAGGYRPQGAAGGWLWGIARRQAAFGLLSGPLLGAYAWVGPIAYAVVAEYAFSANWTSPSIWPGRSPHDPAAATWAALIFVVGVAVIARWGSRHE